MENNKEGFIKSSLRERLLLAEFNKHVDFDVLTVTKSDSYDKYDAVISSGDTEYIVETKVRFYKLAVYNDWIIQKDKWDYLFSQYKKKGLIPLYITFHEDGVQIWDLSLVKEPQWDLSILPKDSQSDDPYWIEKIEGRLMKQDAYIYNIPMPIIKATAKADELFNKYFK